MPEQRPKQIRTEILAWLETASGEELLQVFDLIQILRLRRRYRFGRPGSLPEPDGDREN